MSFIILSILGKFANLKPETNLIRQIFSTELRKYLKYDSKFDRFIFPLSCCIGTKYSRLAKKISSSHSGDIICEYDSCNLHYMVDENRNLIFWFYDSRTHN